MYSNRLRRLPIFLFPITQSIILFPWLSTNSYSIRHLPQSPSFPLITSDFQQKRMTSSSIPSNISNTNNPSSTTTHKHTNALINEQSPYLLQHAHNPVNWYPWYEEAINKAKKENKPIFLSVGYSTCHWCHVMEHESFEDETVANILNKHFICIKVDREERPDVDRMYMNYVTAITQRGGWPMSVWLTPTLQPFFGGTYFPKKTSQNGIGFIQLLEKIINLWSNDQQRVIQQSHETMQMLKNAFTKTNKDIIELLPNKSNELRSELQLGKHFQVLNNKYDTKLFGFGKAPKFPRPSEIQLLLRYYYRYQNSAEGKLALEMCVNTLQAMGNGGINDHIGGGFHRYSVDEYWHVPHFEKMLYDNAQLVNVYLDVYSITKDVYYRTIAEQILEYIMRDMTYEGGGIYSAEDADSIETHINPKSELKKEGAFYIWSENELKEILTDNEFFIVKNIFNVEKKGNCSLSARSDPHREFDGLNVLIKRCSIIDILHKINKLSKKKSLDICSIKEIEVCLESAKKKMFEYRNSTRIRPHLDNKIICSWNGLMLHAFSKAHNVLKLGFGNAMDDRYLIAAKNMADFIYDNMRNANNGHLYRIYGKTSIDGFATDYAFLIYGLLELFEASFDAKYLKWSMELQDIQNELFFDRELGGYYDSMTDDKYILMRIKEEYDGAEPCSTTVSINNLLKLHAIIGKEDYKYVYAKNCLQFIAGTMTSMAMAMPLGCIALDSYENGMKHVVLSAVSEGNLGVNVNEIIDEEKDNVQKANVMNGFLNVLHGHFYDDSVCVVLNDNNILEMTAINEHYGHFGDNESHVLGHVCQSFVCQKPAKNSTEFEYILNNN